MPSRELADRLVDDPCADRDDAPRVLGDGDEVSWADTAQRRVVPAQERLETDGRTVGQRDDRLVDEPELRRSSAWRSEFSQSRRRVARSRNVSSNTVVRDRPPSLASYIAESASRRSVSLVSRSVAWATPTLAVRNSS